MACITLPDDANAVIKRNKLIWLLVGAWGYVDFVLVAQADYDDASRAYARSDYDTTLAERKPFAEQGNAEAQSRFGWVYNNGEG